ncbi:uncharacterized protein EI90DRAFT_82896 [Cantharellus anzutake]|uniref:uncharacterized protein n=1 Tax=Cantharellus anzutake TaxID=1750568 RepID=UPI0019050D55|nr:uncharacterized protein EI90DRAFT_82896 [Cantharellus anzutake]KAF8336891.1 hypothetical protein EI90DRAFT_82896 [Cantharellus anzutake]
MSSALLVILFSLCWSGSFPVVYRSYCPIILVYFLRTLWEKYQSQCWRYAFSLLLTPVHSELLGFYFRPIVVLAVEAGCTVDREGLCCLIHDIRHFDAKLNWLREARRTVSVMYKVPLELQKYLRLWGGWTRRIP